MRSAVQQPCPTLSNGYGFQLGYIRSSDIRMRSDFFVTLLSCLDIGTQTFCELYRNNMVNWPSRRHNYVFNYQKKFATYMIECPVASIYAVPTAENCSFI